MSFAPMQMNHAKTLSNPLVVSAFLTSSIKRFLKEQQKEIIAHAITGLKVTTNSIIILTGKPLINTELKLLKEPLMKVIEDSSTLLHLSDLRHKNIIFR